MPKLLRITSLLFLYNMLRNMLMSMKASYKLILIFFDGYSQAFPKFPRYQLCNAFTISLKKKLEMKLTFFIKINIKFSYQFISALWASKFSTRL